MITLDKNQIEQLVISTAKNILLPRFNEVKRQYKPDGSIVTEADRLMQETLTAKLKQHFPNIALLGEEMPASTQHALFSSGSPLWCLDPVDGTSNFVSGIPYFSVSLALIEDGEITFGLVYDPIRDECFTAQKGAGAWLNQIPLVANKINLTLKQAIAFIDFKRLPKHLATQLVSDRPYGSQRSCGSIALELCWLAAGRGQLYLHGQQHLWDYAAAQLILLESGGYACTFEGKPVYTHTMAPRSTLAANDKTLFEQWQRYLNHVY
jgi:myo-inositol-1(or 4)-monophosphatase